MRLIVFVLAAFALIGSRDALSDVPKRESGADRVLLRDGTQLVGLVLGRSRDGWKVAVDWKWLEQHDADRYAAWRAEWIASERQRRKQLVERIDRWLKEHPDAKELVSFLESERRRLTEGDPDPSRFSFCLRSVPSRQVRRIIRADAQNKKVYWAAWVAGKEDVCNRPVSELRKRLLPAALEGEPDLVDLLPRLPPIPDTDATFRVRKALVEFAYRKPLVFQGTPQMWLPVDAQGQPQMPQDLGKLIERFAGQVLGGGVAGGAPSPRRIASEAAKKAAVSGFLVKELDVARGAVPRNVRVMFYVATPDGSWKPVFRFVEPIKAGDPDKAAELGENPQIKQVLDLAKSLGVRIDPAQLNVALGAGAAVDTALRSASAKFLRLQQAYANSLDTPLFQWR